MSNYQSKPKTKFFNRRLFLKFIILAIAFGSVLAVILLSPHQVINASKVQTEKMKEDYEWAYRLMQGGYILHFRHAEREKWIDVEMYDLMETHLHNKNGKPTRFGEDDYFAKAVCLSERGKIQARTMGEFLRDINFPIGQVISSPSCRSRQTSLLAFGGFDITDRLLVHKGPYFEDENNRIKKLVKLYAGLPNEKGKNIIISAHNSVVDDALFVNDTGELDLEEGGFYVISQRDGKLYLEYEFHNFLHFIRAFYKR